YRWADVNRSEDIELVVETENGRKITSKPVSWYGSFTVVSDGAKGRTIVSISSDEERIRSELNEIAANAYQVSLYGDRRVKGLGSRNLGGEPLKTNRMKLTANIMDFEN